jgi:hypothetical protein
MMLCLYQKRAQLVRAGAFSCFFGGFIRIPLSKMAGA